jgi:hypothetical protein
MEINMSIYRQYFVLTEGKLANIGDHGDWEAAYESANDLFGECGWDWVANYYDVKQWFNCIQEVENEYLLSQ